MYKPPEVRGIYVDISDKVTEIDFSQHQVDLQKAATDANLFN